MRLIDGDVLYERACELEAQALEHLETLIHDDEKIAEWRKWSAILNERTAFKHDIEDAPTIEPQRWVSVTERLPEEDGEYLVANRTINGKPCVYGIDTFANDLYQVDVYDFSDKKGKRGWVFFHDEYGYLEDKTVVAWMPLPEPYKEDNP